MFNVHLMFTTSKSKKRFDCLSTNNLTTKPVEQFPIGNIHISKISFVICCSPETNTEMSVNQDDKFTVSFHQDRKEDILLVAINQETSEIIKKEKKSDETFRCPRCEQMYIDQLDLWKHIQSAHDGRKYACDQCESSYVQHSHLRKHVKSQHEGVRHRCYWCNKQFTRKCNMEAHIRIVHHVHDDEDFAEDVAKFVCKKCDQPFKKYSNLTRHMQGKHEGTKYKCKVCGKEYPWQDSLSYHIKTVHDGIIHDCNECDYQTPYQKMLMKHIQSVHEGIKYACDLCDYETTALSSLHYHVKSVHEGVKYPCQQCEQQFTTRNSLKRHKARKHNQ